jgi:hypothetical protein
MENTKNKYFHSHLDNNDYIFESKYSIAKINKLLKKILIK